MFVEKLEFKVFKVILELGGFKDRLGFKEQLVQVFKEARVFRVLLDHKDLLDFEG